MLGAQIFISDPASLGCCLDGEDKKDLRNIEVELSFSF